MPGDRDPARRLTLSIGLGEASISLVAWEMDIPQPSLAAEWL